MFASRARRTLRMLSVLTLAGLALAGSLLASQPAHAQALPPAPQPAQPTSPTTLYLPQIAAQNPGVNAAATTGAEQTAAQAAGAKRQPLNLLIDADPGIDDAVAIAYILTQKQTPVNVLGVVSVGGNTYVEQTTKNALIILNGLNRTDIPVVKGGSAANLSKTGWFIQGPDGLWGLGFSTPLPPNLAPVSADPAGFYCTQANANPGAVLLALGPLTNVAAAVHQCPAAMQKLGNVVILGGARYGGNKTPVAEFNFWQDPAAAQAVLTAGLTITLVPLDAFAIPTVTLKDVDKLTAQGIPFVKFLDPALRQYITVQLNNGGRAGIPDAVAAAIALDAGVAEKTPGLVKVLDGAGLERGQSVVALTDGDRIAMSADDAYLSGLAESFFTNFNQDALNAALGAILYSNPYNTQFTTAVPANLVEKTVFGALRGK